MSIDGSSSLLELLIIILLHLHLHLHLLVLINILPIIDFSNPNQYRMLINTVDVLFASLDSEEQAHRAELNAKYFLKAGGHYVVYVQTADCIESTNRGTNRGDAVFSGCSKEKRVQFKRMEQVTLEPFDRCHAYVSGVYRTLDVSVRFMPHFVCQGEFSGRNHSKNKFESVAFPWPNFTLSFKKMAEVSICISVAILPF